MRAKPAANPVKAQPTAPAALDPPADVTRRLQNRARAAGAVTDRKPDLIAFLRIVAGWHPQDGHGDGLVAIEQDENDPDMRELKLALAAAL